MTTATLFPNAPDVSAQDYCVFGLATCFVKEDNEYHQAEVIEPIPSAALEAILKGVPTSYHLVCAKSLGEIFGGELLEKPAEFPEDAKFCDDFAVRAVAVSRTYKNHVDATAHIPLGTVREDLNYSLEKKRVLNATRVVSTEDNVKQHSHTHQVL